MISGFQCSSVLTLIPLGGDGITWKQDVLQGFRDSCSLHLQGKVITLCSWLLLLAVSRTFSHFTNTSLSWVKDW